MSELWPYPGSRWWKFDFHTHTPASRDTAWFPLIGTEQELTPDAWLLKYMAASIDCVAITDHNTGEWIDILKSVYRRLEADRPAGFRALSIFPGVELSLCDGIHLLALFDPSRTTAYVSSLLGAVGFPAHLHGQTDANDGAACTRKSLCEAVEQIEHSKGLAIPAHVDQGKGLLEVLGDSQQARHPDAVRSSTGSPILAYEVVDPHARKADLYDQLGISWTQVVGSDCHNFRAQNFPGSAFTWVKMAEPNLEGLRLALIDGNGVSVRRSDEAGAFDPFRTPELFIVSVEIHSARYMGHGVPTTFRFNPYFNAIIGGRGTGKSTVVHSLRLGLHREHDLDVLEKTNEARQTFDRFKVPAKERGSQGGLKPETTISVVISRDDVHHRLTWSASSGRVKVEEKQGVDWSLSGSQDVSSERFPLRIFSQGQIAALAGSDHKALLSIIDEAAGTHDLRRSFEEAQGKFKELCSQSRSLGQQLAASDKTSIALGDVKRKLARFEGTNHADALKRYQNAVRQKRELARQHQRVHEASELVTKLAEDIYPEDAPDGLFQTPRDSAAIAALGAWQTALIKCRDDILRLAEQLRQDGDSVKANLKDDPWFASLAASEDEYVALKVSLETHGVSGPAEFGQLVQERQRLETQSRQLQSLKQRKDELEAQIVHQLQVVVEARRAISQARQSFLVSVLSQNPYVRIQVLPYGREGATIERELRELLGLEKLFEKDIFLIADDGTSSGAVAALLKGLQEGPTASEASEEKLSALKDALAKTCRGDQSHFSGHLCNALKREHSRRPELVDQISCWFPEDSLKVEYSRRGDGRDFQPIDRGSAGQRAAAMLSFLLTHGEEPIILDQPEDDLDNHLIYDLVVRQIRESKRVRQLIVVTHNPNIVVNGDADMLYVMDFKRGQCVVAKAGALQEIEIRKEVCRVMEGGEEAFSRRYHRVGPGALNHVR